MRCDAGMHDVLLLLPLHLKTQPQLGRTGCGQVRYWPSLYGLGSLQFPGIAQRKGTKESIAKVVFRDPAVLAFVLAFLRAPHPSPSSS
jgi:hypothetical protein